MLSRYLFLSLSLSLASGATGSKTLSDLASAFWRLLQQGRVDLKQASEALGVHKRRVYDITNVLSGIDLTQKLVSGKGANRCSQARTPTEHASTCKHTHTHTQ